TAPAYDPESHFIFHGTNLRPFPKICTGPFLRAGHQKYMKFGTTFGPRGVNLPYGKQDCPFFRISLRDPFARVLPPCRVAGRGSPSRRAATLDLGPGGRHGIPQGSLHRTCLYPIP